MDPNSTSDEDYCIWYFNFTSQRKNKCLVIIKRWQLASVSKLLRQSSLVVMTGIPLPFLRRLSFKLLCITKKED